MLSCPHEYDYSRNAVDPARTFDYLDRPCAYAAQFRRDRWQCLWRSKFQYDLFRTPRRREIYFQRYDRGWHFVCGLSFDSSFREVIHVFSFNL